ncbi:MAG: zf-HC2 domain-containing protein [Actinomycetota bacterium]|jgi:anti-sigma factor RsiW|nr:zf-HC2 domain-containing protein [Actinomycetota bacterium]
MPGRHRTPAPMGCREAARVLQSYLDGQLDAAEAGRVADHLEVCRRCGLDAATFRSIKATLAGAAPEPEPGVVDRLEAFARSLGDGKPEHR